MENILKWDDYIQLSSQKQLEFLKTYFDMKNTLVQGYIEDLPDEKQNFIFIRDIVSAELGNYIFNPFTFERIDSIYCSINGEKEKEKLLKKLSKGDKVAVRFKLSKGFNLSPEKLLFTNATSIIKLINVDSLDCHLDTNESIIYNRLFNKDDDFRKEKLLLEETVISNVNDIIKECSKEYNKYKTHTDELLEKLNTYVDEYNNVLKLREKYIKLGLIKDTTIDNILTRDIAIDTNTDDILSTSLNDNEFKEHISTDEINIPKVIQSYLANRPNKKLYYPVSVIEQFYMALHTNQLIILSGQPGTGKTSLVEGMADAIGAICKSIAVRPNWTDAQDLLGYYNPIEKKYIGTPFIDTLVKANKNPNQLYFISLDEMNIACVEHYFSEFLSKLYSEKQELDLYSNEIASQIYNEINLKLDIYLDDENLDDITFDEKINLIKKINVQEYISMKNSLESLEKYPPTINIPQNIKFVGTINKDETTKNLSPKVIDRSFIISLSQNEYNVANDLNNTDDEYINYSNTKLILSANRFISKNEIEDKVVLEMEDVIKAVADLGIQFNNRNLMHSTAMFNVELIDDYNAKDYIIASKILPKLNLNVEPNEKYKIDNLQSLIDHYPVSQKLFAEMIKFWDEYSVLTYWR